MTERLIGGRLRYDILGRAQARARAAMTAEESRAFWNPPGMGKQGRSLTPVDIWNA